MHKTTLYCLLAAFVLSLLIDGTTSAQNQEVMQLSEVKGLITGQQSHDAQFIELQAPWWRDTILQTIEPTAERFEADINQLMYLAVANSAKISIARHVPKIRQTAITEAAAAFDWTRYVQSSWNDVSDPVGSDLTVGAGGTRFRDEKWDFTVGSRRRLVGGGNVDIFQELGHQDNNSTFFVPEDQATSRIVLGYTQPLLRGRGQYYNNSLILLAKIDVTTSEIEFRRQLQSHLLEVARAYWSLYLERARLAQQIRLYKNTNTINEVLKSRQHIDAQRTQLISARAALETRRSDLIRAVAAVKNSETRLRALINAPELNCDNPDQIEIIPIEHPSIEAIPTDLGIEFATAADNRPEIKSALRTIKAACVRLDMSAHEILPRLDLVTQTYISGLRGNSEFGNAWLDQFREGEPSYSVGLNYEFPLGRRASFANRTRRQLELSQMREEYRNSMELVRSEVEIAVREVETAFRELVAKDRARNSAELEAETLEARWRQLPNDIAAGLTLESLLRAQERVNQVEFEFARAQLTYNLALVNLRHANGTLLDVLHFDDPANGMHYIADADSGQSNGESGPVIADAEKEQVASKTIEIANFSPLPDDSQKSVIEEMTDPETTPLENLDVSHPRKKTTIDPNRSSTRRTASTGRNLIR